MAAAERKNELRIYNKCVVNVQEEWRWIKCQS